MAVFSILVLSYILLITPTFHSQDICRHRNYVTSYSPLVTDSLQEYGSRADNTHMDAFHRYRHATSAVGGKADRIYLIVSDLWDLDRVLTSSIANFSLGASTPSLTSVGAASVSLTRISQQLKATDMVGKPPLGKQHLERQRLDIELDKRELPYQHDKIQHEEKVEILQKSEYMIYITIWKSLQK